MSSIKPAIIALVVCDNIYTEPGGKQALVGLFNMIAAARFPTVHGRLAIFVSVTSVRPGSTGRLAIVHGESDQKVAEATGGFGDEVSALDVVDVSFILRNVTFPEAGSYYIQFWVNDHLLVQRPFAIQVLQQGNKS